MDPRAPFAVAPQFARRFHSADRRQPFCSSECSVLDGIAGVGHKEVQEGSLVVRCRNVRVSCQS
ncbi:hypothetical protein EYF80_034364 [Liparis tanakae]|uniref:Uncharacterized protein n=1 Tax=Liparis tanakae TaxID=230148 RepID=A0A4Z2GRW6_9TELE|nr:hypothetical protein EYF80_034364 [Liparis tanakae]